MYSFAINPEDTQPSGTSNFSKLDTITLNLDCSASIPSGIVNVYCINYNILRIQNGMSGLMFSS